ncbi:mannitol dehydrogenase family protein [Bogoriella caseilytica]|uniref:Mannitol-1-phosphate 5-dehydrogenase n=1 Tax=Bogoriella caseilytica TaxID=56055 RepID=A0A3N2BDJ5_9MICO|nr:mannitol dehydrogenase family protein [Bogoriella caseilytica]ROR73114.1 fructuronate reductase [Bogoriella caseilytica]
MTSRLSFATLDQARPAARRPALDPRAMSTGSVHLGVGAFHRAHQAVFTEDAMAAAGESGWGIHAVTQRSARVAEQLDPQDGLYGVLTCGLDGAGEPERSLRIVGAVRAVSFPGEQTGEVLARLAAPTTHLVTLTVTEKGYRRSGDRLDLRDEGVQADLAALREERRTGTAVETAAGSPIGMLARGLARRAHGAATPMSVVCCDNIVHNGPMVGRLVSEFLLAAGADGAAAWVADHVTFPATMVDRIVPATTAAERAAAEAISGLQDEGLVVAEPYRQWVIEDSFAGPRPAWERAGATLTSDVAPFEEAKLRILNGTHSYLAYRGALLGHATIAEAVTDAGLGAEVSAFIDHDVIPTLTPPPGVDLGQYRDSVLERFANPALGHTTQQVAMDGSQKLPVRLLGTAADRLTAGAIPERTARAVAAWMVFVARAADGSSPLVLDDPQAEVLGAAVAGAASGAALADRLLDLEQIFPPALAGDERFRSAVREQVTDLA